MEMIEVEEYLQTVGTKRIRSIGPKGTEIEREGTRKTR